MKRSKLLSILCLLGLTVAGCNIHEVPDGGEPAAVALSLEINLDEDMTQYASIAYATKAAAPQARYILRFFPIVNETVVYDAPFEFIGTEDDLISRRYVLDVPPMNYRLEAWADWAYDDRVFYNAADFDEIAVNTKPYTGASPLRDAFCGAKDIDLSGYTGNHSIATASITLHRPNARFNFISTDREEFLDYWASQVAMNNGTTVKDPDAIDLSKIKVVVTYPQYMPSTYDLREEEVTDSATGVSFETGITTLKDGSLLVAWDYVLASGDESSVVVSLAFYDEDGTLINRIDGVQVPLSPGLVTNITGKLLTSNFSSGIRIDPTFDGEYEVHI